MRIASVYRTDVQHHSTHHHLYKFWVVRAFSIQNQPSEKQKFYRFCKYFLVLTPVYQLSAQSSCFPSRASQYIPFSSSIYCFHTVPISFYDINSGEPAL